MEKVVISVPYERDAPEFGNFMDSLGEMNRDNSFEYKIEICEICKECGAVNDTVKDDGLGNLLCDCCVMETNIFGEVEPIEGIEPLDEHTKKIIDCVKTIEYNANAMRYVNGGLVEVEDVEIDEDENEIRCTVKLHFQGEQKEQIYYNCIYPLDSILKAVKKRDESIPRV